MKALTNEQLQAISTLRELAGGHFRAISFGHNYTEIPTEWFIATFSPGESVKELFIDNPDHQEMHVMRAEWGGKIIETVMTTAEYERWLKKWEGQTNE